MLSDHLAEIKLRESSVSPERSGCIGIPVLPLRDVMVYPYMVIPLFAGREESIRCLEAATDHDKKIMLVAQKETPMDEPGVNDLFIVRTVTFILQIPELPDGTIKVLVEGLQRARISTPSDNGEHFSTEAEYLKLPTIDEWEQEVLVHTTTSQFEGYTKLSEKIPPEALTSLNSIDDPARLANIIVVHMPLKLADKQSVPEMPDVNERLEYLMVMMESEIDLLQVERHIRNRTEKQIEKSQREYYLNEQTGVIRKEFGEMDDVPDENEVLKHKIDTAKMPKEAEEKAEVELQKLKVISPMSAEATVVRGYIDWVMQVPWNARSKVRKDLRQTQEILDTDYYGLGRVKDRILEYPAVQSRVDKIKGLILYLVGPPGVGKTSLGQFIAKATGCRYVHTALGGVHDEAEIRDHRRTYIDSTSGRLTQKTTEVGMKSPLFLLDEVDKVSSDTRSDSAPALLEVLDPKQNVAFSDHHLEMDYDPSDVMFAAMSNSMNIPASLLGRTEVIHLSGHIEDEKLNTTRRHLLPKQIERNALKKDELAVNDSTIISIIRHYTHEADVRDLEREIFKLHHKAVKQLLLDKSLKHIGISGDSLHDYLSVQRFNYGRTDNENRVGQVTGLAWTEVGGDLLTIETTCVPGKGKLTYTGSLGEIMQESIQAALIVVHVYTEKLGVNPDFYGKRDIHVHVPGDATPRDDPSAGIAICTALVSCLIGNPVRADVTTIGEITLRGQVLPIGGLKEKLLAAHRGGIKTVLVSFENKRDLEEIPDNVIADLDIHPMKRVEEALTLVLQNESPGMQVVTVKQ